MTMFGLSAACAKVVRAMERARLKTAGRMGKGKDSIMQHPPSVIQLGRTTRSAHREALRILNATWFAGAPSNMSRLGSHDAAPKGPSVKTLHSLALLFLLALVPGV